MKNPYRPDPTAFSGRYQRCRAVRRSKVRGIEVFAWIGIGSIAFCYAVQAAALPPSDDAEAAAALRSAPMTAASLTPAAVVGGIINFTQWPSALHPIHVCVAGDTAAALELLHSDSLGLPEGFVQVIKIPEQNRVVGNCEVVYLGQAASAMQRQSLATLADLPVLTIGEGAAFCSDGGMFCLEGAIPPVRFGVNLDSISRSGLRVNPQVLWLARRARGATP